MALLVSRRINDPSYNNLYFKSDVLSLMNDLRSVIDDGLLRSFNVLICLPTKQKLMSGKPHQSTPSLLTQEACNQQHIESMTQKKAKKHLGRGSNPQPLD